MGSHQDNVVGELSLIINSLGLLSLFVFKDFKANFFFPNDECEPISVQHADKHFLLGCVKAVSYWTGYWPSKPLTIFCFFWE